MNDVGETPLPIKHQYHDSRTELLKKYIRRRFQEDSMSYVVDKMKTVYAEIVGQALEPFPVKRKTDDRRKVK
jgi:hypothetical protein